MTPEQKARKTEYDSKRYAEQTPEQKAQQVESARKRRAEHPLTPEQKAQRAESKHKWHAEHPLTSEQKAQQAEYKRKRNAEHSRTLTPEQKAHWAHERRIKRCARKYGVSPDEARRLYADSDARGMICPICQTKMHRGGKPDRTIEVVDHSHETGRIRGLICFGCNLMEGHVHALPDRRATIQKLLDYMDAYNISHKEAV